MSYGVITFGAFFGMCVAALAAAFFRSSPMEAWEYPFIFSVNFIFLMGVYRWLLPKNR